MDQLGNITMTHIMAKDILRAEKSLVSQMGAGKSDHWIATVFNSDDEVQTYINRKGEEEDLIRYASKSGDLDHWADRKLTMDSSESDWYAEIKHLHSDVRVIVLRADAIQRIFRNKKSAITTQPRHSTKSLSWQMKIKESKSSFSKG
jgi:hypothetical protein